MIEARLPELPDNPARRLLLVAQLVQLHWPELGAWMHNAAEAHVMQGAELGRALGLAGGTGGRTPRFEILLERRNALLAEALCELETVAALAHEIITYQTRVAGIERTREAPAAHWSRARVLVHQAHRLNVGMPTTEEGLRKALRGPTEMPLLSSADLAHDSSATDTGASNDE